MTGDARPAPAVVIVTHRTRDEVLGCLATCTRAGAGQVVVVDAGSDDGTAETVRAEFSEVAVLELANAGFARCANAGVRATDTEVVVIANADVRFAPGSLTELVAALGADPDLAAVGPKVVYPDGRVQASARREPSPLTALAHAVLGRWAPANPSTRRYRADDLDPDRPRDADWLSGCALAVRRAAFDGVDGFDPGYFLYVEDLDLGLRLRTAGWRLRYHPDADVVHRVGASTRRRRVRSLRTHARSVERWLVHHHPAMRCSRPLVRIALTGWVGSTWVWERTRGRRRSTTGE